MGSNEDFLSHKHGVLSLELDRNTYNVLDLVLGQKGDDMSSDGVYENKDANPAAIFVQGPLGELLLLRKHAKE